HPVVPQALEVAAPDRARAARRVAHQHAAVAQALDHDEVPVTAVVEQDDRRQALLEQLVQRQFEAVGLEAVRLQVATHVEQGESLLADPRLVAVGVHLLEDIGLGDRVSVLVGEQGRGRGRAAAEVVLLRHRGPEPRLLEAGQLDRVTAAVGHAHAHRAGMRRRARGQRERAANGTTGAGGGPHGTGSTNWTFTAVPFWISTLEPLFWITVVMPLALANAPPSIAFRPLSTFSAWLPLTSPSFLVLTTTSDSPPRKASRASSASGCPIADGAAASGIAAWPGGRASWPAAHAAAGTVNAAPATRSGASSGAAFGIGKRIWILLPAG